MSVICTARRVVFNEDAGGAACDVAFLGLEADAIAQLFH
jgi:hypothetical protein